MRHRQTAVQGDDRASKVALGLGDESTTFRCLTGCSFVFPDCCCTRTVTTCIRMTLFPRMPVSLGQAAVGPYFGPSA